MAIVIAIIFMAFPFSGNKSGFNLSTNFSLLPDQRIAVEMADWYKKTIPENSYVYAEAPYIYVALDIDFFDVSKNSPIGAIANTAVKKGSIVIWDSWFSVIEKNISERFFQLHAQEYELLNSFVSQDQKSTIKIYRKRN